MVRILALFSPFPFYTYIKQIFEHHEYFTGPPKVHLLECGAIFLFILRFVVLQLALNFHLTSHLSWDPMAQYIYHYRHLYSGYVFFCLALLGVYALLTTWLFFLKTSDNTSLLKSAPSSALSWQAVAYDLIVRNVDQAEQCIIQRPHNRSTQFLNQKLNKNKVIDKSVFKGSSFRLFYSFQEFIIDKLSLNHLDLGKLGRYQLSIFSFLSVVHRKKVLQFHLLSSLLCRAFQFTSFFPIILGMFFLLLAVIPATSPKTMSFSGWLLLLNDLLLICAFGWSLFRNVLIFLYLAQVHSAAYRWHLGAAHRMLNNLSLRYRSSSTQVLHPWNRLLLRNILTEHAHICALLDRTNRQLTGQAAFAVLLFSCPTNIYLIYRIIYQKILVSEFGISIIFTASQILCMASAFVPLALANGALYRTGKYLPAIQLYVLRGGNNRSLKIKYEILQSTLTESRVKSGTTIGPVCLITSESLYNLVTFYAVYMLAFFVLLPK